MSEPICTRCGRTNIVGCDGRGYIRLEDETTVQKCVNIYRRELMQHLGPEIAGCVHVADTPLLKLNPEGGEPLVDLTKKNLLIECPWRGFLPHLKYALGFKGTVHRHRIITDERIKNVFVGSESYKSRSQKTRDDLDTFNNIADLVGVDFDLVIIKLGYLGYKNQAAAGALKEALLHRDSINKPTWLIQGDADRPWNHSYDPDVGAYIGEHFKSLKIEGAPWAPPPQEENVGMSASEDDAPRTLEEIVAVAPASPVNVEPEVELSNDMNLPGEGQPEKKKYKSSWKKGHR